MGLWEVLCPLASRCLCLLHLSGNFGRWRLCGKRRKTGMGGYTRTPPAIAANQAHTLACSEWQRPASRSCRVIYRTRIGGPAQVWWTRLGCCPRLFCKLLLPSEQARPCTHLLHVAVDLGEGGRDIRKPSSQLSPCLSSPYFSIQHLVFRSTDSRYCLRSLFSPWHTRLSHRHYNTYKDNHTTHTVY